MVSWTRLSLQSKEVISRYLQRCRVVISDHTFTNLWMWDGLRSYHYAEVGSFLCIRFNDQGVEKQLMPLGDGDLRSLFDALQADAASRHVALTIRAITEDRIEAFKSALPSVYRSFAEEDHFDYLYAFEELVHLSGNRFQSKRNLIYQFERHHPYEYRTLNAALLPDVVAMQNAWFVDHVDPPQHLRDEHEGILRVLRDFDKLDVFGGALLVDGKVVAFSIAERLPNGVLLVHIEKAFKEYKGAYQVMNQQLLQHVLPPPPKFVNREEDLGVTTLAQAKESYHPVDKIKKFCLEQMQERH